MIDTVNNLRRFHSSVSYKQPLLRSQETQGSSFSAQQRWLNPENSDLMLENYSSHSWDHHTASKKHCEWGNTVQVHARAGRHGHTMLPRETQITVLLILLDCLPSHPQASSPLVNTLHSSSLLLSSLPTGKQLPQDTALPTWELGDAVVRERCRFCNTPKRTSLRNCFPDSQKCGSSGKPYRKWRWEVERTLILYRNSINMLCQ